jgi:tripartite-type tricarboxylate transporter receptor subunit TctC
MGPGARRRRHFAAKLKASAETKMALFDAGVEPSTSTPEEMSAYLAQEFARWGKVVKAAGVKPE